MKSSVKKFLGCIAILSASHFLFAVETGGLISNDTKFANAEKDGSLKIDQKNAATLWLRTPLSEDGKSYFTTEGAFKSEYDDAEPISDQKMKVSLDINLFKFVIQKELDTGNFVVSLGRFHNSDLSGLIYTQNADGAKFDLNVSRINFSVFGAYTGLLNAKNITILDVEKPDLKDKATTLYVLANKYVVGGATFSLPHIFASQTIAVEGLAALSLESTKLNRFYATAALNGPIVSPVFYKLTSTFGFSKYDDADMETANLTQASIIAYPAFKSMSVSLNGLYASGEQGSFKAFKGFTSGTSVNSLKEPEYTAVTKAGLAATIKPLSNLLLLANGDLVFDAAKDIKYAGFQYSIGANWQAVSDVSFGINFGQFFGKEDYEDTIGGNKTQLKINAAIAF